MYKSNNKKARAAFVWDLLCTYNLSLSIWLLLEEHRFRYTKDVCVFFENLPKCGLFSQFAVVADTGLETENVKIGHSTGFSHNFFYLEIKKNFCLRRRIKYFRYFLVSEPKHLCMCKPDLWYK